MSNFFRALRRGMTPPASILVSLILAGCGLGMDNAARLERAQSAFEASEYRAAIIDTKNILQQEPENRQARLLLGRSSLRVNDAATAEKELRRAISLGADLKSVAVDLGLAMLALRQHEKLLEEIQPGLAGSVEDRLSILRLRGDAMMGLERPAAAREMYREALASAADDLPSLLGVASSYIAEQNYDDARKAVGDALAIDASYVPARLASGSIYMETRDTDAAVDEFQQAAELAAAASGRRDEIAALSGLVEAQLSQRDVTAAKESLARLEELAPDNLSTVYLTARVAYLEEDYELANGELQKLLGAAPEYQPALFLMGAVQLQRGNLGQAEMHLSSVVAASPYNADARKLLAEIRLRQDRADEAADILRPLLQTGDADVGALNLAVRASLEAGEVDSAVEYLRQALGNDPGNMSIQLDLAAAHLAAGEIDEAEALLATPSGTAEDDERNTYRRELLKVMTPLRRGDPSSALRDARVMAGRWPDDARVQNLIGGIALAMEDLELARESFLAAQELDPSDVASYLNVAGIDLQRGDLDAAREQYRAALDLQPGSTRLMVALATLEARAEDPDAAVQWLERAVAADVTAMAPRLLLARYWVGERAFEAAEPVASAAVGLDETNAEAHNLLGLAQQGTGKSAEALASFTEAARLDPEQSVYRMNKARVEMAMGEMDLAEETLLGSEGIDLDDIRASVLVAAMKAREGDAAGAMKIAKDLQAHHPDDAVPYALEAELLAVGRRFEKAAAVYEKALSLRPEDRRLALRAFRVRNTGRLENPEAPLLDYLERRPLDTELRLVVAQAWQSRGERARAIAEYERVLATAPDDFVALNNLAWAYFEGGDPRAEELARRAFEQSPENGSVADTLGWIQVKKGNVDEGIPNLRKAVEFSDGNPEVKYHLAAGLAAAGEADEARRILEETLSAADDFGGRQEAKRLLESL